MKGEANPGMESVRKLVSRLRQAPSVGPHPDADLLSAFAENTLPEAERGNLLAHLADCGVCREVVFLSCPQPAEGQKVFIPRRGRWPVSLRWASVAASMVILAGVFEARRELSHRPPRLTKIATASQLPPTSKVAEEKVPSELNSMRVERSEDQRMTAPAATAERVRPDLKHMTAKMQRSLTFGQSDEVQVSPPSPSPNLTPDTLAIRDLPVQGREVRELDGNAARPAAPNALAATAEPKDVPPIQNNSKTAMVPILSGALAKQAAGKPHLAGTVFDVSGARVPNAKVTTLGPVGSETVTSDEQGRFAFNVLTPGLYSVKAEASGFSPVELKQVPIAANQSPSLELKLAPGAAAETVEVSAQAAVLDSSRTHPDATAETLAVRKKAETRDNRRAAPAANQVAGMVPALQWTLSPGGAVQSSMDGGKTWQLVAVAAKRNFRALSAVGASVWVGGSGGSLYHSADAGRNWTAVVPGAQGRKLNSDITRIEFLDLREGSLSTSNGESWITHDGGDTWERNGSAGRE